MAAMAQEYLWSFFIVFSIQDKHFQRRTHWNTLNMRDSVHWLNLEVRKTEHMCKKCKCTSERQEACQADSQTLSTAWSNRSE